MKDFQPTTCLQTFAFPACCCLFFCSSFTCSRRSNRGCACLGTPILLLFVSSRFPRPSTLAAWSIPSLNRIYSLRSGAGVSGIKLDSLLSFPALFKTWWLLLLALWRWKSLRRALFTLRFYRCAAWRNLCASSVSIRAGLNSDIRLQVHFRFVFAFHIAVPHLLLLLLNPSFKSCCTT